MTDDQKATGTAEKSAIPQGADALREMFLSVPYRTETVEIDGLGPVNIRELSGTEQQSFAERAKEFEKDGTAATASMILQCVVDDAGKKVFRSGDVDKIKEMPGRILLDLAREIQRVNGFGDAGQEEIEKN